MTELSKMLEEYRAGERELPTYDELAALLDKPLPVRVFQSAEQNEQLARDAQATLDAEMHGVGFLVDGVSVHPSRVTVLRPQVIADERPYAQNLELVIERLEVISQNATDAPRTLADEALVCARAALAAAPAAQGDAWRDKCEALIDMWDDSVKPEDQRVYVSGAFPEMLEEIRAAIAAKAAS